MTSLIGWISEDGAAVVEVGDPAPAAFAGIARRPRRWRRAAAIVAVTCVVGSGITAWVMPHRSAQSGRTNTTSTQDLTTYTDAAKHYRISYPREWQATTDAVGGLVLHVRGQNAVSVRELDLAAAVNTQNVADMRAVTDAILSAPKASLTVLDSQQVRIGTLVGLYYLYYFPAGAQRGVHAHYFLFSGTRMFTLVFQTLPVADFEPLAKTFDAVAQSFAVTPGQ